VLVSALKGFSGLDPWFTVDIVYVET
jgi:hypothetical protein